MLCDGSRGVRRLLESTALGNGRKLHRRKSGLSYRGFSDLVPGFRRGLPPRNSKWLSFTTLAMEDARPSQRTRANWRAESQAALYQTPGFSPG
jgi:hypothetical protein